MKEVLFNQGKRIDGLPSYYSHLGIGVFETFIISKLREFEIVGFKQHLVRLQAGATKLGLRVPSISTLIQTLNSGLLELQLSDGDSALVRVVVHEDSWLLRISLWKPELDVDKGIVIYPVTCDRPLPEVKSCSAVASYYARNKAKENQADEGLIVDMNGYVRECAWGNIFFVNSHSQLCTPAERVLAGVTRNLVLQNASNLAHSLAEFSLDELVQSATELFMTQSTHGIVPIRAIKHRAKTINFAAPGPVTLHFQELYSSWYSPLGD